MKITKSQLRQIIKEELAAAAVDWEDERTPAAAETMASGMGHQPQVALAIIKVLESSVSNSGELLFPKTAAAFRKGFERAMDQIDMEYMDYDA